MTLYPLLAGLGVAGAVYAAKGVLHLARRLQSNPEALRQMGAAAAGARAVGERFSPSALREQLSFLKGPSASGFNAAMNRREAALILGA